MEMKPNRLNCDVFEQRSRAASLTPFIDATRLSVRAWRVFNRIDAHLRRVSPAEW